MQKLIPLLLLASLSAQADNYSCSWLAEGDDKPTISTVDVTGSTAKVIVTNRYGAGPHDFTVFKNNEEELLLVKSPQTKLPGETKTAGASLMLYLIDKVNMESAWGYFGNISGVKIDTGKCVALQN